MSLVFILSVLLVLVQAASGSDCFWLLTDFHYDPTYNTTQDSCNEVVPSSELGKYGSFDCDPPWELVKSSVESLKDSSLGCPDPEFIIWLGDVPYHAKNKSTRSPEMVHRLIQNATDLIQDVFPDVQVYTTLGNHDFDPVSQLPGENNPTYDAVADMWSVWLNDTESQKTFRKGAYYTQLMKEKVRAVIFNTNLYYTADKVTKDQDDPGDQYVWFEEVMTQARANGERVHLITHVPLGQLETPNGIFWLEPKHNEKIHKLMIKYADIIIASYSAHAHTDSFKVFYDQEGTPVSSMLIIPAVSPWRARIAPGILGLYHNPSVRKFKINPETYELTDIDQYFLKLNKANEKETAEWVLEYTFTDAYGLQNVSTSELQKLLTSFKDDNSKNFIKYQEYNTVKVEAGMNPACDAKCKKRHICAIEYVDYTKFDQCFAEDPPSRSATITGSLELIMIMLPLFHIT